MKNRRYGRLCAAVLPGLLACFLLTGCGTPKTEFDSAQEAKEALNTAEIIDIYSNLYTPSSRTKIVADGKVAGYLQGQTVYIDGEKWFSINDVTDEPINDMEGVSSGTTYGYYDADGDCLGYAQKRYLDTDTGDREQFLVFLDADGTELPYCSSRLGDKLFDEDGNVVGTGEANWKGVNFLERIYTNIYRTRFETDPDAQLTVDFMDRMAMYECLQEDIRLVVDAPVNTVVEILATIAVVVVLFFVIGSRFAKVKNVEEKEDSVEK